MDVYTRTRGITRESCGCASRRPTATLPVTWADGTRFRITVYTPAQWREVPEDERPASCWLDDTGTHYLALTPA